MNKGTTYAYCRISRPQQSIQRQIRNVKVFASEAVIFEEAYTGTKMDRPIWNKLFEKVQKNDTIIFDSVSRMSRSAEEGVRIYFELYNRGVKLVFLKEPYIDSEVYANAVSQSIAATGNNIADIYIEATNKVIQLLAVQQIKAAFLQAEKEVSDLHQRTKEGIAVARLNGKQVGQVKGKVLNVKKKEPAKAMIRKHNRAFGGSLNDAECIQLTKLSRNTYFKYKKEIKEEM